MAELVLEGCRTTPLSGYLSALGVHRAVHRLLDSGAAGCWKQGGYFLRSQFDTIDELTLALHGRFKPESIVSPWNSGSGFAANGKSPAAERLIQWVRESSDKRLEELRRAVAGADRVVTEGRRLGIADLWDKKRKPEVLRLCRNELPDAAVAWLDAAIALGQDDDPSYSRLLGTGGNLGRQDLSVTYLQQVRTVFEHRDSVAWLTSALDGRQRAPLSKDSPGQFDAGGVGASDEPTLGNPWVFLFVIEGTLLFATAVVRRYGVAYSGAALPFQVAGSTAGFASAASGERPLAEFWAPEWPEPLRIPDMVQLLGEGRADWNFRPARSGLDMARAAATLGVDRGIRVFHRHVFVDRLGQSPIAVTAGRIEVSVRGGVDLLAPLDRWREALRRSDPPSHIGARLRALDQAIFSHASTGEPAALIEVFVALGRCRYAASRSGKVREDKLPVLSFSHGIKLLDQLRDTTHHDRELRIALALTTSRDQTDTFRRWLRDPLLVGVLATGLAEIARRPAFPLATQEAITDRMPSVRGARIVFERGMRLGSGDMQAFVEGAIDDERTAALILGLSCIDWRYSGNENLPGGASAHEPPLDLLMLFTGMAPFDYANTEGEQRSLFARPGHEWPSRLIAGHVQAVLDDASRRLHIAGLRHVVTVHGCLYDGRRLAGALLLTTKTADRRLALSRIAVVGAQRIQQPEEATT